MAAKLIMCKGLPGSGKSTWASATFDNDQKGTVVVTKDDIRLELNVPWNRDVEKEVLKRRDFKIAQGLSKGATVISCDTNLAPKHETTLRAIAKKYKAEFEIKSFLDVSLETCIERDSKRVEGHVSEKVIRDMYTQFVASREPVITPYTPPADGTKAIIVDLDGTLCLHSGRSPYDTAMCFSDKPFDAIVDLITTIHADKTAILYVSGREDKFRDLSQNWLDSYGCPPGQLWMRPSGDLRNDAVIKQEIFDREIRDKFKVRFVLDDRDRVVKMWRDLGLTCLQVNYGDF